MFRAFWSQAFWSRFSPTIQILFSLAYLPWSGLRTLTCSIWAGQGWSRTGFLVESSIWFIKSELTFLGQSLRGLRWQVTSSRHLRCLSQYFSRSELTSFCLHTSLINIFLADDQLHEKSEFFWWYQHQGICEMWVIEWTISWLNNLVIGDENFWWGKFAYVRVKTFRPRCEGKLFWWGKKWARAIDPLWVRFFKPPREGESLYLMGVGPLAKFPHQNSAFSSHQPLLLKPPQIVPGMKLIRWKKPGFFMRWIIG
jgi:hypothetical protein